MKSLAELFEEMKVRAERVDELETIEKLIQALNKCREQRNNLYKGDFVSQNIIDSDDEILSDILSE